MPTDNQTLAPPWTILKTLQWTADFFGKHRIANPRSDAEILLAHALACERIDLYLHHDQPLQEQELGRFKALIRRRAQTEPVAYIIGAKEFWSLDFTVTPDVLIPRPETEVLVEAALRSCAVEKELHVLELGTGSGIISVALARECAGWRFLATDISHKAIEIARGNALRHLDEDRIEFVVGHWFDPISIKSCFDLVISNPPYVVRDDIATLEPDVYRYEPTLALDGGPDGLVSEALIINTASSYLRPGGNLLLEIGYDQGPAVEAIGQACGDFDQIVIEKDYSGHDRTVRMRKKIGGQLPSQ
ncbi:MAG: peptide chain release factor N(5)-glutamine methyltransferase [Desulfobacteraceae bacterium]|jgi:release factor glutamine methyltransferase